MTRSSERHAWIFPGQGSQAVGMGREACRSSRAARDVFERADAALGEPLSRLIFEGPEPELTYTPNAQPALVATSIAILAAALEKGVGETLSPSMVAGHSVGEFSALVATGSLDVEDAVRIVRARGLAMDAAVQRGTGGMVAVLGLDVPAVEELVQEAADGEETALSLANLNAPGQVVLAGSTDAIERLCDLGEERDIKVVMLNVSGPFHSSVMRPAADALREELRKVSLRSPTVPLIANIDGRAHRDVSEIVECLVRQVHSPVLWEKCVRFMEANGIDSAFEMGPGTVLTKLGTRITDRIKWTRIDDRLR